MENTGDEQVNKFIKEYNQLFNVPNHKASIGICEQYQREHANEFKTSDWVLEKHRKRFMDWMSRQSIITLESMNK